MQTLRLINYMITIVFMLCYAYQFLYIPVVWFRKRKRPEREAEPHSFAVLICARNEAEVIGDLLDSLHRQTYNQSLIRVFVMADNCTDHTARAAMDGGAAVYTRSDSRRVGKGYALTALMRQIKEDYPAGFDAYLILDADNILAPDYIEQMNRSLSQGHDIITGFRNSKNYGDNWISAGYSLWFLRESRYLNHARFLLNLSCAVSGTGFLFSRRIAEEMDGWPYHRLTEDIEFSVDQICKGRKIAFCPEAELYDEQPVTFAQSWRQRMRWVKGGLQVFRSYGWRLLKGICRGSFSCYDMTMSVMPAFFLSVISIVCNLLILMQGTVTGDEIWIAVRSTAELIGNMYLTLFVAGAITTVTEWKRIHTGRWKKLLFTVTFPIFAFTYIPIALAAPFCKVGWKPIRHSVTAAKLAQGGLILLSKGRTEES